MSIFQLKKSAALKFASVFVGGAMALSLVFGGAVDPAQAQTVEELTALINGLLAQIATLQTQLTGIGGETTGTVTYSFTKNLSQGDSGADVLNLQKVLNMSADTQVAATGVGSAGNETEYFGSLTKAAVVKFQNKYVSEILTPVGLTAGTGYVGASTRAKLNTMTAAPVTPTDPTDPTYPSGCTSEAGFSPTTGQACSGTGTPVVVTPTGTGLTVTPGVQPVATLAVGGATRIPFTTVVLTASADGDIVVNSLLVERDSLSQDAAFAGIVLLDESGMQLGISKTLNSLHQSTIGEAFTVYAGTSKTVTVAANMTTKDEMEAYTGQVGSLEVVGVNSSATVNASFPIQGARHTLNSSLEIGTATPSRGPLDPGADAISKEIGATGYTFSSLRVTAGAPEDIRLHSVRWNQSGSAASGDLDNIAVYVDGIAYTTVVSADGKYYTATFGDGVVIAKGLSKEVSIKGDIVGGSTRGVTFDLYKSTDIYVTGETYNYGIAADDQNITTDTFAEGTFDDERTPAYPAYDVTISAGTVTSISKSNDAAAQKINVLTANQPLGGFTVNTRGEAITVQKMIFNVQATGGEAENITNISLVDGNGSVVAGPVNGASTGTDPVYGTITFTDTVTLPVGETTLFLKGQLGSAFVSGDTVAASTTPSTQWTTVTGEETGDTIDLSTFASPITGNTMTVAAGALDMSLSTQPTARVVIAGAQGFEFARYTLDAGQSGEDVRLVSMKALLAFTDPVTANDLQNCNLYDGTDPVTNNTTVTLAAGDVSFTFDDGGLIIPKGTSKTVSMKCDLAASATSGDITWGFTSNTGDTPATGVESGQTVAETMTTATGQKMTAGSNGTYTVTNDSSLLYTTAQAGVNGVTLASLRFTAGSTEAVELEQIALQLGNTALSSPNDLVGQVVNIYNGITPIGTATFGGSSPDNATSTPLSPSPVIQPGESVLLTFKANLTAHNVNDGTPGAFISVTYDGDNVGSNGNYATGVSSQATISSGTTADVTTNGLRVFRTVPSFAVTSNGGTGTLVAGSDLYSFTVTNPNDREAVFKKFSLSVATSGSETVDINDFTLYGDGVAFNNIATSTTGTETIVEFEADTTSQAKIIPANSSKTYVVRAGTVTNPSTVVIDSVTFALLADTSYPAMLSTDLMGSVATVELGEANTDNIIWSPFSTTTPVATEDTEDNLDWVNGYGLPGFPANAAFTTQTWTSAN